MIYFKDGPLDGHQEPLLAPGIPMQAVWTDGHYRVPGMPDDFHRKLDDYTNGESSRND